MQHSIRLLLFSIGLFYFNTTLSQNIGIGTTAPNASAQLDVSSNNKGILVPRVSLASLTDDATIANPATSLLVYNTNAGLTGGAGYYFNSGTPTVPNWTKILTTSNSAWLLTGNSDINPAVHFIGNINPGSLKFRVSNIPSGMIEPSSYSVYFGQHSGEGSTNTPENAAFGHSASPLYGGLRCTAIGAFTLANNQQFGYFNTAIGARSMYSNTTGSNNTAVGVTALHNNQTGDYNVAVGDSAMYGTSNVSNCVGIGKNALKLNTNSNTIGIGRAALENNTANSNTAVGDAAMRTNTTGFSNVAMGTFALTGNTTGGRNTAIGYHALRDNEAGQGNTAVGWGALSENPYGSANTAVGNAAMQGANGNFAINNIAVGFNALHTTEGGDNLAIGNYAMEEVGYASNNVAIGNYALRNLRYSSTGGLPWSSDNVAIGKYAMENTASTSTTTGYRNVAVGTYALQANTTGSRNVVMGFQALLANTTGTSNTAVGTGAGSFNNANSTCSFFGNEADQATGSNYTNSTAIGSLSRITASDQVRIGSSTVSSIGGYAAWSNLSDGRFKKNIRESVKGLDFIMALRPVTYNIDAIALAAYLKEDLRKDSNGNIIKVEAAESTLQSRNAQSLVVQTGFIAQEVEAAATKLGYDFSGVDKPKNADDLYALRYSEFVVPLVKAVQEQQAEIAELKKLVTELKVLLEKK